MQLAKDTGPGILILVYNNNALNNAEHMYPMQQKGKRKGKEV